ncbi:MAG: short-chain dehydrogenase [Zetaproteobacteria bacterium]|nr:short-chain dehydrogenase [Pseudobdellovibrionaceae bacterium]
MSQFVGKTIIITGASQGVGAAVAKAFAAQKAKLVLIARTKDVLESFGATLIEKTEVMTFAMNVGDMKACSEMIDTVVKKWGRIDYLINNAGYHQRGPVTTNEPEDLARMVDINLRAPIALTRMVLPFIQKNGNGAIVNVGSLAGLTPLQGAATYAATKAGLRSFTYALHDELRATGIHVGLVSPGPINTGFIMADMDQVEDIVFSQPMSSAEEVSDAILLVASGERLEIAMPRISGWLSTLSYLIPWLRRMARPLLYRKGKRLKERYRRARS